MAASERKRTIPSPTYDAGYLAGKQSAVRELIAAFQIMEGQAEYIASRFTAAEFITKFKENLVKDLEKLEG